MGALSESEVAIGVISIDSHVAAAGKNRFVPITRREPHHEERTLGNGHTVDLSVLRRSAPHSRRGRLKPQNFLYSTVDQFRVSPQLRLLIRVLNEQHHPPGNRIGRRLVTRHQDLLNHAQRLRLGEQSTLVNRVIRQIGNDVVFRVLPHSVDKIRKVVLELHDVFGVLNLLVFICQSAEARCRGVRPFLKQGQLGARNAQLVCNDINGERHAETIKQVYFTLIDPIINEAFSDCLNVWTHPFDTLIGENFVNQVTVNTMPGRILCEQRFHHFIALLIDSGRLFI